MLRPLSSPGSIGFGLPARVAASGGLAPVAGMSVWAKGDAGVLDGSGNPCTDGVACATWNDQSGNANNFAQATGGNRGLYKVDGGYGSVLFDGISQFMTSVSVLAPRTVFIVARYATGTTYGGYNVYVGGDAASSNWTIGLAGSSNLYNGNFSASYVDGISAVETAPITTRKVIATYPSFFNSGHAMIGKNTAGGDPGNAYIYEVLLYPTALSDPDRETTEAYLFGKYGI